MAPSPPDAGVGALVGTGAGVGAGVGAVVGTGEGVSTGTWGVDSGVAVGSVTSDPPDGVSTGLTLSWGSWVGFSLTAGVVTGSSLGLGVLLGRLLELPPEELEFPPEEFPLDELLPEELPPL